MDPSTIQPVILTCDRDLKTVQAFVESYSKVILKHNRFGEMPPPVTVVDLTSRPSQVSTDYLSALTWLRAEDVTFHPRLPDVSDYESAQDAAWFALRQSVENRSPRTEAILWLEDDIVFADDFMEMLRDLVLPKDCGFFNLYQPGRGHGYPTIDPNRFYGTQALLFPLKVAEVLNTDRDWVLKTWPPGWDIQWSRAVANYGLKIYSTKRSFVQHQGVSHLHPTRFHFSEVF